jgi:hypothetical protein
VGLSSKLLSLAVSLYARLMSPLKVNRHLWKTLLPNVKSPGNVPSETTPQLTKNEAVRPVLLANLAVATVSRLTLGSVRPPMPRRLLGWLKAYIGNRCTRDSEM